MGRAQSKAALLPCQRKASELLDCFRKTNNTRGRACVIVEISTAQHSQTQVN